MDAKEILWNYFLSTGKIGGYLLIKEIEQVENNNLEAQESSERLPIQRSDNLEE